MTSEVQISNLGLATLGEKAFIQSLTENSVQARYANLFYEPARKATLRVHPWNFARTRVALSLKSDVAVGKYQYTYGVPSACLRARYIENNGINDDAPFELGLSEDGNERIIYTNVTGAVLIYTANVTNPNLFDSMFVDAFALNLAYRLAPVIAPSKSQEMATRYINAMKQAMAADAGEGVPEPWQAPDWLEARIGGSTAADALYDIRRSLET